MDKKICCEKNRKDAHIIIALSLVKHLYNEGKISELVYKNIRKEAIEKISVENRALIW